MTYRKREVKKELTELEVGWRKRRGGEMPREQDLLLPKRRLLHCSVCVADRLERGSTA